VFGDFYSLKTKLNNCSIKQDRNSQNANHDQQGNFTGTTHKKNMYTKTTAAFANKSAKSNMNKV